MSKHSDYIAYFEQLAIQYCQHTEEEKHFFRKGLEEFLNGLQTQVNYPALLLESYDFKYMDNGADSVMKNRTLAFMVIDHVSDLEDYEAIDLKRDSTEEIIDKIFNQIRNDIHYLKNEFLNDADLNSVQVSPIENYADLNIGWYVTIQVQTFHNTKI